MARGGKRIGAGRKKGSLGVVGSFRTRVKEYLLRENFNPFKELVELYRKETTSDQMKFNIAKELAAYVAPKLKPVDPYRYVEAKGVTVVLGSPQPQTSNEIHVNG